MEETEMPDAPPQEETTETPPFKAPPRVEKPYVPVRHTPRPRPEQASSSVAKAAEEVRHIVASLEESLENMEEVLRLVELAEGQKHDDEREIENLRRALRRFQQPQREHERREPFRRGEPRREEFHRDEPPREEVPPDPETSEERPTEGGDPDEQGS